MIRIGREQVFPTPVERGFSFITDVGKWPSYWSGLVRIEPESHWGTPGDQARVIVRLFGRDVELVMTLREFVPFQLVAYDSVQAGLPDAHHERHFRPVDGGFAYRILVEYEPRTGPIRAARQDVSFAAASPARYGRRCSTWSVYSRRRRPPVDDCAQRRAPRECTNASRYSSALPGVELDRGWIAPPCAVVPIAYRPGLCG